MAFDTIHLISDSTGETLRSFARASVAHFDFGTPPTEKMWSLVRSASSLEEVLTKIEQHPGPVLYTLADQSLSSRVREFCLAQQLPSYPLLEESISFFAKAFDLKPQRKLNLSYHHSEASLSRLAAMEFALIHDDGQNPAGYKDADVVVVGVSRTSKTPTCIYLANRGIRAANYPLVPGAPLPPELTELKSAHGVPVIGLTLSTRHLLDMRRTRMDQLGQDSSNAYVDHENIRLEITLAKRIYDEQGWHSIDVTRRSVEETSALILQHLDK